MNDKEKYNWKGNSLVYSERHGLHLRPTAKRQQNTMKEHTDYLKRTGDLRDVESNITQKDKKSSEKA
jgi:hypothetical protein